MRVLLVDDHPAIRLGMKSLLDLTDDIQVVGEAKDADGAMRLVTELEPDLVVLDLRLKGETGGIEVCRDIKALPGPPRVLIHTAHNRAEDLAMVTLVGADGYLHKGVEDAELPEVVRRTHAGERVWLLTINPDEAEYHLLDTLKYESLTSKEKEVLTLVLRRHSNAEIAKELYVSLPTVKTHVRNILRKYEVSSRRDLFRRHAPNS